jgi:tetratricopeptide (TPR) repeat protein
MEAAQLHKEAANYYYQALIKKPEYIEAREALYRSGGQVLNDKLSVFFNESQMGNKKVAINAYLDAKKYKDQLANVSVKLSIPAQYTEDFNEIKKEYLLELYEQGLVFLDQEDYESAEEMFREIVRLEPNYKDTKKLKDIALIEPFYRDGVTALEEFKYRSSYNAFLEVLLINAKYKDAEELQQMALEEGMVNVGLIPFENATTAENAQKKAEAYNLNALNQTKDPFLTVIDRTNYQQLLDEQRINLSGAVDESSAAEAGKLLGVKWLLGGTLLEMTRKTGAVSRQKRNGFKSFRVKKLNEAGEEYYETQYKPTVYYEYQQRNSVTVSQQLKLISLTTGEIEVSKIITKEVSDQVHYYAYEGDPTKLYPAIDGKVAPNRSDKSRLDQYLAANREIKSVETLSNEAFIKVAEQIKSEVEKFAYYYVK